MRKVTCLCGRELLIKSNEEVEIIEDIKNFIINNSSVSAFSTYWKGYYDWSGAGIETLQAYAKDCGKHKNQVTKFLKDFSEEKLEILRNEEILKDKYNTANNILKRIGYEFIE